MKKLILTTAILLLYNSFIAAQIKETDPMQYEKLNGKVKITNEVSSSPIYGKRKKITGWKTDSTFKAFNETGNLSEEKEYKDGSLIKKIIFEFDNKENIIHQSLFAPDGSLTKKISYKYDDKRNLIEAIEYKSDGGLAIKDTYKYDTSGNKIEYKSYKNDSVITLKFLYKYNDKGKKIEMISYQPQKPNEKVSAEKYDDNGRVIEKHTYGPYNMLFAGTTYKYNDKGDIAEEKFYLSNMQGMSYGQLMQMTASGKAPPLVLFMTNNYSYEYDEKLNWIKKDATKRTIVYY